MRPWAGDQGPMARPVVCYCFRASGSSGLLYSTKAASAMQEGREWTVDGEHRLADGRGALQLWPGQSTMPGQAERLGTGALGLELGPRTRRTAGGQCEHRSW